MKLIVSLLLAFTVLFAACSTQRVLVESHMPGQTKLTAQTHGCRLHRQSTVFYPCWGACGTKSTANLVEGARGPVRIEFKNTPGTVLLEALFWPFTLGFIKVKKLEVYDCGR
jgi:hypothetical protein